MSSTDPNPNPIQHPDPPVRSAAWSSYAPSSPTAPGGVPPVPPRNSVGTKSKSLLAGVLPRIVAGVVVLALAYGAYWYFVVHKNSQTVADAIPATGSCFSWTDANGAKVLPCTDASAVYKAEGSSTGSDAAADKKCDSLGAYVEFGITSTARNTSASGTICAALNLKVGDCAHQDPTGSSIIPCDQAAGDDVKVLSLQKVTSAAETMSDSKAVSVCGSTATQYLSDVADTTIVCVGKP